MSTLRASAYRCCLVEKLRNDALLDIIQSVLESENPQEKFKDLTECLEDYRPVRISSKHMAVSSCRDCW